MQKRLQKSLFVWDLDNTLTDTASVWSKASGLAIEMLMEKLSLDRAVMREAVLRAPAQFRFANFRRLMDWMVDEKIIPAPSGPADQYMAAIQRSAIADAWFRIQEKETALYPDTVETQKAIHVSGSGIAIYTDAEASSMIRRMWLLARNAVKSGIIADENDLLDSIDQLYAQPSIEDDYHELKTTDTSFVHLLKKKLSIFKPDPVTGGELRKPNGPHLHRIMKDFGVLPEQTIMFGDSDKDSGSAKLAGVDFGWVKFGADLNQRTIDVALMFASPGYKYGLQAITDAMQKQGSVPAIVLESGLKEILEKVDCLPCPGFQMFSCPSCSGSSGSGCRHTDDCPEEQMAAQTVHRLGPLFRSQARQSPTGPATHFPAPLPPEPPKPA